MKKYKNVYILLLLFLFVLIYSFKKYHLYNLEINNLKKISLKKEKLLKNNINLKKEIVYLDEYKNLAISSETEFLKIIFNLIEISNLKLIDSSSLVKKAEDEKYELFYKTFKIKGDLLNFYYFLNYIFLTSIYIDTKYTDIEIDYNEIIISLGYIILK